VGRESGDVEELMATKPKPKPDPDPDEPEPEPEPDDDVAAKYPDTIEGMIAAMHYHVSDGNAPAELPRVLELLNERMTKLEERVNAPPIGIGKRP
jgi:hypothetical protein